MSEVEYAEVVITVTTSRGVQTLRAGKVVDLSFATDISKDPAFGGEARRRIRSASPERITFSFKPLQETPGGSAYTVENREIAYTPQDAP